jgi:hypothetical protein
MQTQMSSLARECGVRAPQGFDAGNQGRTILPVKPKEGIDKCPRSLSIPKTVPAGFSEDASTGIGTPRSIYRVTVLGEKFRATVRKCWTASREHKNPRG